MAKTYQVKVYSATDEYITVWKDIVSSIEFNNELNSAGGQLSITLARNAGDYGEGTDVDFNLKVKVYCFDNEATTGTLVFQGYVSSYTPVYKDDNVLVTVLCYGSEFERFMLQEPIDLTNSVVTDGGTVTGRLAPSYAPNTTIGGDPDGAGDYAMTGVKFTTPASMVKIPQIDVAFNHKNVYTDATDTLTKYEYTLTLYPLNGTYPDYTAPLGSVTLPVGTAPITTFNFDSYTSDVGQPPYPNVYSFIFDTPVDVVGGTTYVFVIKAPDGIMAYDALAASTIGDTWCEWYYDTNTSRTIDSYGVANVSVPLVLGYYDPLGEGMHLGQSFVPTKAYYITAADVWLAKNSSPTGNAYVQIYAATGTHGTNAVPTGSALATSSAIDVTALPTSISPTASSLRTVTFSGANQIMLEANTTYCFVIEYTNGNSSNDIEAAADDTSPSHAGNYFIDTAPNTWVAYNAIDLCFALYGKDVITTSINYFKGRLSGAGTEAYSASSRVIPHAVYCLDGTTTVSYTDTDPAEILMDIIDKYNFLGGTITYDADSIDLTGTTVSYTFNTNTILEAVNKVVELCPEGWYYYIDQATNIIHLHEKTNTPDHVFALEKDVADARFEKRIEDLVNTVYFTGGGSPPLYKKYTNSNSVSKYGVKSQKYTDQRVTDENTAEVIANSILSTKSEPELRVTIEVLDSNNNQDMGYDIESVDVGDVVAIRNVSQQVGLNTWDVGRWDDAYWDFNVYNLSSLQMQVQKIEYREDVMTISASTMAVGVNKRIEDINRSLEASQTVNNPSTPT